MRQTTLPSSIICCGSVSLHVDLPAGRPPSWRKGVTEALGIHRSAIYKWISLYREGGIEALEGRKAAGPTPKLDGTQLRRLYMIITSSNPLQHAFEFALWTRAIVREVTATV